MRNFAADMQYTLNIKGRLMELTEPQVMGILNVTPDSFYAASRAETKEAIAERARQIAGEGGTIIGSPLKGRVVINDDVISAGTSVRESTKLIEAAGATPSAVLIALDRQEKGGNATEMTETSAVQDVEKTLGIPVVSIASLENLLAFMDGDSPAAREAAKFRDAVAAYRARYGA
jgi:orotate phosphoribosyltransferase